MYGIGVLVGGAIFLATPLNTIDVNILFTKQRNQLLYLDLLLTKSVDKFEASVFWKKTITNLCMK